MNKKQFIAREQMRGKDDPDAEMTGPGMTTESYEHPSGTGGAGGSPCKFRKREGTLGDKRIIHGMRMK